MIRAVQPEDRNVVETLLGLMFAEIDPDASIFARDAAAQLAEVYLRALPENALGLLGCEPRDAASKDAASGDAASGDAASGDAASGDAASGDAASGDAKPGDAKPGDAKPADRGVALLLARFESRPLREHSRVLYIDAAYTPPACRGRGFMHELTKRALERARTLGALRAVLGTPATNAPALRFWEKLGFREDFVMLGKSL